MKKSLLIYCLLPILAISATLSACSAQEFTAATYTTDATITAVSVDVTDRKVVFETSSDNATHVDYYYSETENYSFTVNDGLLSITQNDSKNWYDFLGTDGERSQRIIKVYLPSNYLNSLSVNTTNFDITLSDIYVSGDCSLYSNGGNVCVERLYTGGTASLSAKDGDVTGSILGTYEEHILDITVKKGESNLVSKTTGEKLLKINVNNGDLNLQFVTC